MCLTWEVGNPVKLRYDLNQAMKSAEYHGDDRFRGLRSEWKVSINQRFLIIRRRNTALINKPYTSDPSSDIFAVMEKIIAHDFKLFGISFANVLNIESIRDFLEDYEYKLNPYLMVKGVKKNDVQLQSS